MEVMVNGEKRAISEEVQTVDQLLAHLHINKETVVVEHNLKILKRREMSESKVKEGDSVEIIKFVAGG